MKKKRISSCRITHLTPNEIFVFGSNLQGTHGREAVRMVYEHFGAEWGSGLGLFGQSYAIPTIQDGVGTIKSYVDDFLRFAIEHRELDSLVTEIGCGIVGFYKRNTGFFMNAYSQ